VRVLTLKRIAGRDDGTFGVLLDEGEYPFAVTLELPWRNNEIRRSCIPAGNYRCERVLSPKFGNTFEITNVPGRTHILFHKANVDDDLLGCIGVGEMFEPWSDGSVSIQQSGKAFGEFLTRTADVDAFLLNVYWT